VRPVRAAEGANGHERARLTLSKLINSLSDAFLKESREDLQRQLTNGEIALGQRNLLDDRMIDKAVGHGDADSDFRTLAGLCAQTGLDPSRFETLVADAAESYKADRGRLLIERAFGEDGGDAGLPGSVT
jgi:hypothetical protein